MSGAHTLKISVSVDVGLGNWIGKMSENTLNFLVFGCASSEVVGNRCVVVISRITDRVAWMPEFKKTRTPSEALVAFAASIALTDQTERSD